MNLESTRSFQNRFHSIDEMANDVELETEADGNL